MKETEIWADIPNYEGKYQVSSLGQVKSLNYRGNTGKEQILKVLERGNGYFYVDLYDENGKPHHKNIHNLVADAFLDNPLNLPCVNHKDENKANCRLDNLERCTYKYNSNYGTAISRTREKLINNYNNFAAIEKCKRAVVQYSLDMVKIKEYSSTKEAGDAMGAINGSNIVACCKGKRKYAYGFVWRYKDEEVSDTID